MHIFLGMLRNLMPTVNYENLLFFSNFESNSFFSLPADNLVLISLSNEM